MFHKVAPEALHLDEEVRNQHKRSVHVTAKLHILNFAHMSPYSHRVSSGVLQERKGNRMLEKGDPKENLKTGCFGCAFVGAALCFWAYSFIANVPSNSVRGTASLDPPTSSIAGKEVPKAWYEGGTLHKANMREWSRASYQNRLATSGDFVTRLVMDDGGVPPVHKLRPVAELLERNITAANKGGVANDHEVTEVAATVWALIRGQATALLR